MLKILALLLQHYDRGDNSMITSDNLHELIKLKISDRDRFLQLIEAMALNSVDVLLTYKKFKEYPANV